MRGAWIENGTLRLRNDLPDPSADAGKSRVRVDLAGVCATDLALRRGYMGFAGIPGHEFVGTALDGPLAGRRVVGDINAACGTCARCESGDGHHCPRRTVLGIVAHGGCFAETLVLPDENLVAVPDTVSDDAAVFAEPLAAAFEIVQQIDPAAHREVLVAGDGRLGLLCALVLADAGLQVTLAGRHPERAAFLPENVHHVTGLLEDPERDRARFDLAVEATGRATTLPAMLSRVAPRGTIVLKTTTEAPISIDLAPLVVDEITMIGSRCGPMDVAIEALAAGRIDPTPLIQHRYPLTRAVDAVEHAARGGVLKILIEPDAQ